MRIRRLSVLGFAVAIALGIGCAELIGLDPLKDRPDGGGDVDVPDVAATDASDANDPCALAVVPPRPAKDDPSDASLTIINVVRTLDLGQRPDGAAPPLFGYDLDGVNTCCANAPESCVPPTTTASHCDEDGGRDNAAGPLLQVIAQYGITAADQQTIDNGIDAGGGSVLLVIKGYNGQANDTQVTAALYASAGFVHEADGGLPPANWDGNDIWTVDPSSTLGLDDAGLPIPIQFDATAYVANGVFVTVADFPLLFGNAIATVVLSGGVMTGQLVPQGGSFRIDDGQGAGRMKVSNLLSLIRQFQDPITTGFICPGTVTYDNAKPLICQRADIMSDKALDRSGATCDALSVTLGFTTFPARIGPITSYDAGKPVSNCLDAGIDNCP